MDVFTRGKVTVTGGAGFIGSHVVEALVAAGYGVVVIDDLSSGKRENLAGVINRITFLEDSILSPRAMQRAAEGSDALIHLAAFVSVPGSIADPVKSNEVNVSGTLAALVAARTAGVRRFIYISSSAVYGSTEALPCDENQPYMPESPYAAQKMMGEEYTKLFTKLWGIESVRLRFFNVYGPRQNPEGGYAAVIPAFVSRAKRRMAPTIYGDGSATRDFIYVGDVVNAIVLSLAAPDVSGGVFNVASGTETSVLDLARAVSAATGNDIGPIHAPAREGDILRSVADVRRAADALGFRAVVPLTDGLMETSASY